MSLMTLPILVSCIPVLSNSGILGRSWHPLWEPESPRLALSELSAYSWDSPYHRMRPVGGDGTQIPHLNRTLGLLRRDYTAVDPDGAPRGHES